MEPSPSEEHTPTAVEALRQEFNDQLTDIREMLHQLTANLAAVQIPTGTPHGEGFHTPDPAPPAPFPAPPGPQHNAAPRGNGYHDPPYAPRVPQYVNQPPQGFDITKAVRVDPPSYDGLGEPQVFLDWVMEIECYFEWHNLNDMHRVQVARMKLLGRAKIFWLNEERRLGVVNGVPRIDWRGMKELLTAQYVPSYHRQQMFDELASLRQGSRSVSEYMSCLKDMLVRCDVRERPEVTLSRFRKGLNADIQGKLLRYGHTDLNATFNTALDIEKHNAFKSKSRSLQKGKSILGAPPPPTVRDKGRYRSTDPNSVVVTARNVRHPTGERVPVGRVSKTNVTCFSCGVQGHYASECPTKPKPLALMESSSDPTDYEYEACEEPDPDGFPSDLEDEINMMVMRCVLATPRSSEDWNRNNIFSYIFRSGDKLCKLIIDSGSCMNVVSENAVSRMSLTPEPHPNPYKVAWVNKTTLPVTKRCLVPLTIRAYTEQIWCDVLPMDACHILLGRPWLYDHDVTHYGRANTYEFKFRGKTIVLKPTPPKDPSIPAKETSVLGEKKTLSLIGKKEFMRDSFVDGVMYALVCLQVKENISNFDDLPLPIRTLLEDFKDIYPDELPPTLPPMRDIQHAIDFVPGSSLPNLPIIDLIPQPTKSYNAKF